MNPNLDPADDTDFDALRERMEARAQQDADYLAECMPDPDAENDILTGVRYGERYEDTVCPIALALKREWAGLIVSADGGCVRIGSNTYTLKEKTQ